MNGVYCIGLTNDVALWCILLWQLYSECRHLTLRSATVHLSSLAAIQWWAVIIFATLSVVMKLLNGKVSRLLRHGFLGKQ